MPLVWQLLALAGATVLALLAINRVPLTYTLRNLSVRWVTTLLTALAFTFVVGLLVVMLAFTNGMRRMTEGTGQPGNVLVLAEGSTDESFSNLSVGDLAEIEHLPQVERDSRTGRPLASRETYLIVNQPLPQATASGPQRRFLQLRGIEDPAVAVKVHAVELLPGGCWFSEAGVEELPGRAPAPPRPCKPCWARAWPACSPPTAPPRSAPRPRSPTAWASATASASASGPGSSRAS